MNVELKAGQWYRNREGTICYCVGPLKREADRFMVETANGLCDEFEGNGLACKTTDQDDDDEWKHLDLIEHLPDCNSFDWEPPKPIEPPKGWRLLTEKDEITVDDLWLDNDRKWRNFTFMSSDICGSRWNQDRHPFMARKIEPKYRQFTWDERDQLRGSWIKFFVDGKLKEMQICWFEEWPAGSYSINGYRGEWLFENATFFNGARFGYHVCE